MWSRGAFARFPSKDHAVRCPVPVTMMAIALPLAHPGRLTTSWTTALRLGVRSFAPTSLVTHATGAQLADAAVSGRAEMLPAAVLKTSGLSAACPWNTRLVTSLCDCAALNWM